MQSHGLVHERRGVIRFDYMDPKITSNKHLITDPSKPLFRGFVGGNAFITKKGYRGLAVESAWSQNIFQSFEDDDVEIAQYALKSSIADLSEVVENGYDGSPFSIGEYGFYAENQFKEQFEVLSRVERDLAKQRKQYYSEGEWMKIDEMLSFIAHHSTTSVKRVVRGDTFGSLALRKHAFQVATLFLTTTDVPAVDPLIENEEGKDMFDIAKEQYFVLSVYLKDLTNRRTDYLEGDTKIREVIETLRKEYVKSIEAFEGILQVSRALQENFLKRQVLIDMDISFHRRCELLHQPTPEQKLWNISQKEKLLKHMEEVKDLIQYSEDKVKLAKKGSNLFEEGIAKQEAEDNDRLGFLEDILSGAIKVGNNRNSRESFYNRYLPTMDINNMSSRYSTMSRAIVGVEESERKADNRSSVKAGRRMSMAGNRLLLTSSVADASKLNSQVKIDLEHQPTDALGKLVETHDTVIFYK